MANDNNVSKIGLLNVLFQTQYSTEETFFEQVPTATLLAFIQRHNWNSHPRLNDFKNYLITRLSPKENEGSLVDRVNALKLTLTNTTNLPAGLSPAIVQNDSLAQSQILSSNNNNNNSLAQAEIYYQQALLLEQQNRLDEARQKYSQASELQHPEAAYKLGIFYRNTHQFAAAGFFIKAAEGGKEEAWIQLGDIHAGWGLHSDAVAYYNRAPQHLRPNLQGDETPEDTNVQSENESFEIEDNHNNNNVHENANDYSSQNELEVWDSHSGSELEVQNSDSED